MLAKQCPRCNMITWECVDQIKTYAEICTHCGYMNEIKNKTSLTISSVQIATALKARLKRTKTLLQ